jgi:hypothetical protein
MNLQIIMICIILMLIVFAGIEVIVELIKDKESKDVFYCTLILAMLVGAYKYLVLTL